MTKYEIINIILIIILIFTSMNLLVYASPDDIKEENKEIPVEVIKAVPIKKAKLQKYHDKIGKGVKVLSNSKLEKYKEKGLITQEDYDKINLTRYKNEEDFKKAIKKFMDDWREILVYATAFGTLSAFLIFIIIFLRLSFLPSHPIERRKAMTDMITSGIATALLGGITLLLSIFYDTFSGIIENGIMLTNDWKVSFNILLYEYRGFIVGFLGLATLTLVLMFIKNFMNLAVSAGNPTKRSQALTGVLLTGVASMGIGGLTFWVYFFQNILK
ncbi:hypothetical protein [uncultured Tissierella sp.]|uniref:hypothetical protein n=1 Tax=uncultured Tissierella sp. TaxID=448160 RepID=UPI002805ADAF|nr:hypothetical protein [uncultured Tissierella sp.]MDU5080533.1 hypothetical protein [Bacillota bacterium]